MKKSAPKWETRRGRCRGGGQSSKAKGRSACQNVKKLLLDYLPLKDDDVHVKAGSQIGADLHLSPTATQEFPFSIEVKNVEALNIFKALSQAESNKGNLAPIVFFKRAHTPMFVALRAEDFLKLFET